MLTTQKCKTYKAALVHTMKTCGRSRGYTSTLSLPQHYTEMSDPHPTPLALYQQEMTT